MFAKFIDPPTEPPRTLDRVAGDVFFRRVVGDHFDLPLPFRLPNGKNKLRMWVIGNPDGRRLSRRQLMRVRAGQTVHADDHDQHRPAHDPLARHRAAPR